MKYMMVRCNLKLDKLDEALLHIQNWEPYKILGKNCISYESVQESDNQTAVMIFLKLVNKSAYKIFLENEQIKKFVFQLDSLCVAPPNWSNPNIVGSLRNSKDRPNLYSLIKFGVINSKLLETKSLISSFIQTIGKTQNDVNIYESFQDDKDELSFTHLMAFKNRDAEKNHRNATHTKKFTKMLFENCVTEPKFDYLELIDRQDLAQ